MIKKRSPFCSVILIIGLAAGWSTLQGGKITTALSHKAGQISDTSRAELATATARPPRIDHILLEVTDITASAVFYRDILHLRQKSLDKTFCMLEGGNVDIYLSTVPWGWKATRRKGERLGLGMYPHFEVDSVQKMVSLIKKAGYTISQEPQVYDWGTEAFVTDPDGYTWALIKLKK